MEKQTQRLIHEILRGQSTYNTLERIRNRFSKWNLTGWPTIHAQRCLNNLKHIMTNTAPRIGLTCWHTIHRRWCAARRFGTRTQQSCLMGCEQQDDSVEHYAHCRIIREWAQRRLQLHYHHENAKMVWTQTMATTPLDLVKAAYMIYAAYRATNHFRHNGVDLDHTKQKKTATEYLNQIIHEADKGQH